MPISQMSVFCFGGKSLKPEGILVHQTEVKVQNRSKTKAVSLKGQFQGLFNVHPAISNHLANF